MCIMNKCKNIFLETQKLQTEAGQRWRNIRAAPVWTGAGDSLPGGRIVLEQNQLLQDQKSLDITPHHIYDIYIHILFTSLRHIQWL